MAYLGLQQHCLGDVKAAQPSQAIQDIYQGTVIALQDFLGLNQLDSVEINGPTLYAHNLFQVVQFSLGTSLAIARGPYTTASFEARKPGLDCGHFLTSSFMPSTIST